jgi:uncharacterized protein YigE (DUF2233 family)
MKNKIIQTGKLTASLFCLAVLSSFLSPNQSKHQSHFFAGVDSLEKRTQLFIDSVYPFIFDYNELEYNSGKFVEQLAELEGLKEKAKADSVAHAGNINLKEICENIGKLSDGDVLALIKGKFDVLHFTEARIKLFNDSINNVNSAKANNENKLKDTYNEYNGKLQSLWALVNSLGLGKGTKKVGKNKFTYFIADTALYDVKILPPPATGPSRIKDVVQEGIAKKEMVAMVTNAGMYTPEFRAQGLLIANFKQVQPIDTAHPTNAGNFYMMPNGVFYMDSTGRFNVSSTEDFLKKNMGTIEYATQSGPLLVNNRKINSNFKAKSTNLNIRSGVGVMKGNKVIFVISDNPVNFFDFAIFFKDVFQCDYALYLDGAISKMYINDKLPKGKVAVTSDGTFGPMISITQKKK